MAMQATERKALAGKFVWFEHVSSNPKKAQAFFAEVLGWKVEGWNDTGYEMIMTGDTMDSMVGGYETLKSANAAAHWMSYLSVTDVDAAAKAAAANGGKILEAPHDLVGVGRAARVADPQGAELWLFKNDRGDPADPTAHRSPPPGRFFWCELHTTNTPSAVSFYEKVIGYLDQPMDMGAGGVYHILSKDGVGRAGVTGHLPSGTPPHWLPYVSVDDPDATMARAKKHGGKAHVEPMDIPGLGRFGVLEDPTGAALAVMKAIPPNA